MPSQRPPLVNGELYHICYRAVGDSVVFKDENDYYRGIFSCYEFNNDNPVDIWLRRKQRKREKSLLKELGGRTLQDLQIMPTRNMFVEIMAFCFMPNHIHLILRQIKDSGISNFVQKIGGYTTYFNEKYDRKGHLFNRFKAIHIKTDKQLRNAFIYVHCNPLSLVEPGWKKNGIKDRSRAVNFLEKEYRWSSFFDFIGKKNFPSVTERNFLFDFMGGEIGCREAVENWIEYKKEFKDFGNIVLE